MKHVLMAMVRFYRKFISPLRAPAAVLCPPALSMHWKHWKNTALSRAAGWH